MMNSVIHSPATDSNKVSEHDGEIVLPKRGFPRRSGLKSFRTVSIQKEEPTFNKKTEFVVQSIRRGSQEWRQLVKPFVADLCYMNVVSRHFVRQNQRPLFRPYTCQAAVLFVDISGYSKIAAALAERGGGAHALSSAVNGYLSRLLHIVQQHGGDVVKFAGDAVLCLFWHDSGKTTEKTEKDSNNSSSTSRHVVCCAAQCAMALQQQAGRHVVEGTDHVFTIHVGLTCGTVESEIFVAPVHDHMQPLYHLVGGEAIREIGDLVDLAKTGEVCVSAAVMELLRSTQGVQASYQAIKEDLLNEYYNKTDVGPLDLEKLQEEDPQLLTDLRLQEEFSEALDLFVEDTMIDRLERRVGCNEEDFIHPAVLDLLSHGGMSPTQIAQMRDLVVLFIAQTSRGTPANWLIEVQAVLERNHCPLLQIVYDDKGVHAIAAVNASAAVPESRLQGLEICRQLVHQKIGVAIGMAAGSTFCGVTGSSSVACRWDITGGPPVRAARLMQYALKHQVPMAIDESVYVGQTVPARMMVLEENVPIKGSPAPIRVFTLSEATEFAAMNLLETVHGEIHNDQVQAIHEHISGPRNRSAVVVTGPTLSGKKIVCQRAAGFANMVPFLHVSDSSYGLLQLARTVSIWFKYVCEEETVRKRALDVLRLLDEKLLSLAHDECVALVDDAMKAGLVACFIVDRVEFLDAYSISLIRECLYGSKFRQKWIEADVRRSQCDFMTSFSLNEGNGEKGRIAFLCVHVPLYNQPSSQSVADDIMRSHRTLSVPVIEVNAATIDQFRELTNTMTGARFDERVIYVGSAAAGQCAGYFIERVAAIGQSAPTRAKQGKRMLVELGDDLIYRIPLGCLREYKRMPVIEIGPDIAMRYAQVYDDLPPMMQVFCKVLALVSQTDFYWAPRIRVWEVLNDLIAEGVDSDLMSIILNEMSSLYLVNIWVEDGVEFVKFQSPALADIALDVCTPIQIRSIAEAWIERLEPDISTDFRVPLVVAWLNFMGDPYKKCKGHIARSSQLWRQGYDRMKQESKESGWTEARTARWKELIACEVEAGDAEVENVLGPDSGNRKVFGKSVSMEFMGIWFYRGPIALGPLGNTLSVITERITQEVLLFVDVAKEDKRQQCRQCLVNASKRYVTEIQIVEELLSKHGLGAEPSDLEIEKELIERVGKPAKEKSEVFEKARSFTNTLVPRFIVPRLQRLHALVKKLDYEPTPDFVKAVKSYAVRKAFRVMFEQRSSCISQANEVNSAQHALMVLATQGWQPRPPPEPMRHLVRQTVARLRNAVVRKLSAGQLHYHGHQQGAVDLKAFLITTALLFDAQDTGRYIV